ncbi:hypothetical protein [Granulicatella seriolae]|uniref:Uncharacterized protein n=1 Tax=Granulicatella seriolae TaxID=2967226 RepID=A0ABT1WRF9_9LACT|nr:hypothetical protein [Granulicatella seriolae]
MEEEREIKDFDDIGLHILSMPKDAPGYYYRGISEYARAKGVEMADLSDEEREMFRTR